ncbi:MFS transporter [Alcanivorax sp. JB21]|uniref:MFS transporter n=1 Tax=Alcanivorax limicola TaxID=2874102 RepID=UPI001CBBFD8E|nr:MFS transporter [Alcanivorax limicola]MBZ2187470.1 MFS transporter [Alcanivorax limicola]
MLSVIALFISLALLVSGSAMLGTLIALRLDMEGVAEATLGLIMAFYSVGFVLGATYAVSIIRQVGHIRAFAAFAAVACATVLMHPVIVSPEAWAIMRLVVGFCLAGLMTVSESWINDRATNESRGKLLGIYTINFYLASALGQLLVGLGNPLEFVAYSVVAMLIVLSMVPLTLTQSLIPTPPSPTEHLGIRKLIRQAPAGMTGVLVSGIALGAFLALAPVYALRAGLALGELSLYMGFSVICAVVLQWPAGWLSDRIGRLPVLTGLLFAGALAAAITSVLGGFSMLALFLFSGIFFAVAASTYPVSVALANDQLPNDQLVAACAGLLRTYGVGTMIGPLAGAALMGVFGAPALFVFISLVLLLGGAAVFYRFRASDQVPLAEQGEYVTVTPASTPMLAEIDPRNEDFEEHHTGEPAEWDIADKLEMLVVGAEDTAAEKLAADEEAGESGEPLSGEQSSGESLSGEEEEQPPGPRRD